MSQMPSQNLEAHSWSVSVGDLGRAGFSFHLLTQGMDTLQLTFCLKGSNPLEMGNQGRHIYSMKDKS